MIVLKGDKMINQKIAEKMPHGGDPSYIVVAYTMQLKAVRFGGQSSSIEEQRKAGLDG